MATILINIYVLCLLSFILIPDPIKQAFILIIYVFLFQLIID